MKNLFSKISFFLQKPNLIIVTGQGKETALEAIFWILKNSLPIKKISLANLPFLKKRETLLLETDLVDLDFFKFLIKNSQQKILVVTHFEEIPADKDFFASPLEKTKEVRELAKLLSPEDFLVLNFDDETVREIKNESPAKSLNFGFGQKADFQASDLKLNRGTNFKINYQGKIVPIWLEKIFGKEQVYSALTGTVLGTIFGLNLIEISQAFKDYQSIPGKKILIPGIKNSWILDDSKETSLFSLIETIKIFSELKDFKKKIAVLGDIIGLGKYSIEAHETIGEKVVSVSDLLFTFGQRAKFIAQRANLEGLPLEKVFSFDNIEEGKLKLQAEIEEGDLILVAGSPEMKMEKVIEEIKA